MSVPMNPQYILNPATHLRTPGPIAVQAHLDNILERQALHGILDTTGPIAPRNAPQTRHHQDQDPSQRPGVKRSKSFGERGLKFLSEAAALYAATQAGKDDRGRSQSRDRPHRSSHHDSEPKHSHHRRSPTPSPSPSRRRSRAYSDDPPRRHRRHRSSQSDDSDYDHDRGRRHRHSRANSYRPSPSRSPSRHRGRHTKSASSSFRSTRQEGPSRAPDKEVADRWQAAARAALEAGGLAAFRLRKEPGSWTGEKGAKVATAALGAAAIDAFMDKDPRRVKSGGVKGFAENAISGLIASKIIGGKSPSKRRGKH
ncbi:hypothetical protein AAE478_005046 [Parahypoxylon ruwenzoriense]